MTSFSVTRTIKAPIEQVFDALIDADKIPQSRFAYVKRIREAAAGKDGKGTQREVSYGLGWFREEFTRFDRPHRMDYHIFESHPLLEHQTGRFELRRVAEGTEVVWSTTYMVPMPVLSGLVTAMTVPLFKTAFNAALLFVDRKLQAENRATS